jgi:hypothetical protein
MNATYLIIDTRTGATVGTAKSLKAARQSVDRRDNAYGGYRYAYKRVEAA